MLPREPPDLRHLGRDRRQSPAPGCRPPHQAAGRTRPTAPGRKWPLRITIRAAASGMATRATSSAALVGALSARRNGVSAIGATLVNRQSSLSHGGKSELRKMRRTLLAKLAQPRGRRARRGSAGSGRTRPDTSRDVRQPLTSRYDLAPALRATVALFLELERQLAAAGADQHAVAEHVHVVRARCSSAAADSG